MLGWLLKNVGQAACLTGAIDYSCDESNLYDYKNLIVSTVGAFCWMVGNYLESQDIRVQRVHHVYEARHTKYVQETHDIVPVLLGQLNEVVSDFGMGTALFQLVKRSGTGKAFRFFIGVSNWLALHEIEKEIATHVMKGKSGHLDIPIKWGKVRWGVILLSDILQVASLKDGLSPDVSLVLFGLGLSLSMSELYFGRKLDNDVELKSTLARRGMKANALWNMIIIGQDLYENKMTRYDILNNGYAAVSTVLLVRSVVYLEHSFGPKPQMQIEVLPDEENGLPQPEEEKRLLSAAADDQDDGFGAAPRLVEEDAGSPQPDPVDEERPRIRP